MERAFFEAFEHGIDRRGTFCEKWDFNEKNFGRANVIPMWVADMDFASPDCVREALICRASHGAYGYTDDNDMMRGAVASWMKARHGYDMCPEWGLYSSGVVDSILFALKTFTQPGDRVIVQPPVYGPFYRMTRTADCEIVRNPLVETENGWRMNLDELESQLKAGARAFILCSPHNPVGRVWSKDELQALIGLLNRYGAALISDEIHADFALPGHAHTCCQTLSGAEQSILLVSATKTFNLAGLRTSTMIVPDDALRARVQDTMKKMGADTPNIFGSVAQTAAYRCAAPWLDALIEYLDNNRREAEAFFKSVPEIVPSRKEGPYLMWADCPEPGLSQEGRGAAFGSRQGSSGKGTGWESCGPRLRTGVGRACRVGCHRPRCGSRSHRAR